MRRILIGILSFLCTHCAYTQLNFQFAAELYGKTVDGLGMFQVQNLGTQNMRGQIIITVSETNSYSNVVIVTTPLITFTPGTTIFPKSSFLNSAFNFSPTSWGSISSQTRNFPPGDYNFCFKFLPEDKQQNEEYENCFEATIQPLAPIDLIVPVNLDNFCMKRPMLSWRPPLPYSADMRFRLLIVEKKQTQDVESILMDQPLALIDNISGTTINYPSIYPELKEGKTYCWQVIAYQQGIVISKSEVWEFTIQCNESVPTTPNDSYRELKLLTNGNYYIANRYLKFSFYNHYSAQKLNYEILDMAKANSKIKHLPELVLTPGLNKIDLDLSDAELQSGQHYILKIYPFNESPIEIRFVYQDKEIDLN
jgi:hypothetical protein